MDPFPADRRARRRGMGKLWIGMLVALISVAAVAYFVYDSLQPGDSMPHKQAVDKPVPEPAANAAKNSSETARKPRASNRSDQILTCTAIDGTVFYTNANRCEEADLESRISEVPAMEKLPQSRPECLGAQAGGSRVHGFLAVCMEPFNKALELERFLLESDDPVNSRAGERYCAFITEGVQAGCMATSDQFCFLDICQAQREGQSP